MAASTLEYSTAETPLSAYGPRIKTLGVGGFGAVSEHKLGSHTYAIKKLLPLEQDQDENVAFETFLCEVAYPQCLNHPNIIRYSGIYYTDGVFAMVSSKARMDLASLSVTSYFKDHVYTVRNVATQLISAVAYLQAHNVMHCDIKPENVLCYFYPTVHPGYFRAVLADFGLAQTSVCNRTMRETGLYTSWYKAPEILRYQAYTEQAEIWALGCTFYEMLGMGPAFFLDTTSDYSKATDQVSDDTSDGNGLSDDYNVKSLGSGLIGTYNERMIYLILGTLGGMGGYKPLEFPSWTPPHFENLISSMLRIYDRPSVSKVQAHKFFAYPGRDTDPFVHWSISAPCNDRITNLKTPDFIDSENLLIYNDSDLMIILNWIDTVIDYNLESDTDLLRVTWLIKLIFLGYMSHTSVPKKHLQLYACAALFLIANWYDATIFNYTFLNLVETTGEQYTVDMMRKATLDVAFDLKFQFLFANPYDILGHITAELDANVEKNMAVTLLMAASSVPSLVTRPDLSTICLKVARQYLKSEVFDDSDFTAAMLSLTKIKGLHVNHSGLWTDYIGSL